jgi:hypothetical protein
MMLQARHEEPTLLSSGQPNGPRTYVPVGVCLRTPRSWSVAKTKVHVTRSSPHNRSASDAVRLSPGISRYSP